ncbi:MAG: hypothetical protein M1834_002460 [Cirrosporium novae-zelandiae]|nr:MAG: hypothetical protein M1834_002460 [Cirrosporium novae-zelandiae]
MSRQKPVSNRGSERNVPTPLKEYSKDCLLSSISSLLDVADTRLYQDGTLTKQAIYSKLSPSRFHTQSPEDLIQAALGRLFVGPNKDGMEEHLDVDQFLASMSLDSIKTKMAPRIKDRAKKRLSMRSNDSGYAGSEFSRFDPLINGFAVMSDNPCRLDNSSYGNHPGSQNGSCIDRADSPENMAPSATTSRVSISPKTHTHANTAYYRRNSNFDVCKDDKLEDPISISDSDTESTLSDEDDSINFIKAKGKLVQCLMKEFYNLLGQNDADSPHQHAPSTSASRSSARGANQPSQWYPRGRSSGKRQIHDRDSSPPGDDEDDEDGRRKRRKSDSPIDETDERKLFACPFHKYDPKKYSCNDTTKIKYRTCAGPGFGSIARLRQHLKRVHKPVVQCHRCWSTFRDQQELVNHQRSINQCHVLPWQAVEGICQDKMDLINKRSTSWEEIYEILFPGTSVPGPYHESFTESFDRPQSPTSQEFTKYESYSRTELPRLVQAELEDMVTEGMICLEEKLKATVVDVIRKCQRTLERNWHNDRSTSLHDDTRDMTFHHSQTFSALNAILDFGTGDIQPSHSMAFSTTSQPSSAQTLATSSISSSQPARSQVSNLPSSTMQPHHQLLGQISQHDHRKNSDSGDSGYASDTLGHRKPPNTTNNNNNITSNPPQIWSSSTQDEDDQLYRNLNLDHLNTDVGGFNLSSRSRRPACFPSPNFAFDFEAHRQSESAASFAWNQIPGTRGGFFWDNNNDSDREFEPAFDPLQNTTSSSNSGSGGGSGIWKSHNHSHETQHRNTADDDINSANNNWSSFSESFGNDDGYQ